MRSALINQKKMIAARPPRNIAILANLDVTVRSEQKQPDIAPRP